jgi:excisionase family DNA binding protein
MRRRSSLTPAQLSRWLTSGQFASALGVSDQTVKRMCDRHEIAHITISSRGDRRIPSSELDRLLDLAESRRRAAADE